MVKHLEAMTFLRFEDVAIGIIAQICEVPCDSNGWTLTDNCAANDHNFVLHRRVSPALMVREHWKILKEERLLNGHLYLKIRALVAMNDRLELILMPA